MSHNPRFSLTPKVINRLSWSIKAIALFAFAAAAIAGYPAKIAFAAEALASGIPLIDNSSPTSIVSAYVADNGCPSGSYGYSNEEDAVMDTIPGEWWQPSDYGVSIIPYSALKSAAVIVRSRIQYENSSTGGYSYTTANLNYHGGQNLLTHPNCDTYEMNTILANNPTGAGRNAGNSANYNSNGATSATGQYGSYQHVVDITPSSLMLIRWNYSVEKSTVTCNNNSGDYEFCVLRALFGDVTNNVVETAIQCLNPTGDCLSDNRYARNISNAQTSPSGPLVQFQAEALVERIHPLLSHYWWCKSDQSGYSGYCAMRPEPDNGANVYIADYASSPFLVYHVPFPASVPHYVWIYVWACGGPDDTVFASMDGVLTPGEEPVMTVCGGCTWQWKSQLRDGGRPVISPGWTETNGSYHRFYLWMKEDGIRIDKITLTQDRCWKPAGAATPPGC